MSVSILDKPPYINIPRILSNKTRLLLIKTIENLEDLFSKMKHLESNPTTQAIVDRYFDYLKKSCLSIDLLNRRAKWLSTYAQSVYIHVVSDYRRIKSRTYRTTHDENNPLLPQLIDLIVDCVSMRLKDDDVHDEDALLARLLSEVIHASESIDPLHNITHYRELEQQIQALLRSDTYVGIPDAFALHTIDALKDVLLKIERYQNS